MKDAYRSNDRRVIPWLLVGLVTLFGGLYLTGYAVASDRVPRGTTVSGVEIGGLTPAGARAALSTALSGPARATIPVRALDTNSRIDPARAGLRVDVTASVSQAGGGRSWDPTRIWDSLTGGDDFDAVVTVDQDQLAEAIGSFAREVDTSPQDGAVVFRRQKAVPTAPVEGERVDPLAAAEAVRAAYLGGSTRVELPTEVVRPEIDAGDVSQAMAEFANPAVSGAVSLVLGSERVVLTRRDLVPALSMVAQDGELVPRVDETRLVRRIDARRRSSAQAPEDATVRLVKGRPKVIKATNGVTFDSGELTEGLVNVLAQREGSRRLRLATKPVRPDFTTKHARGLGVREVVSEFTTYFPHSDYRNTNLGRAAELINGTLLMPGDVFSLNSLVGERTAKNGFVKGFIISDGVFKEDFGGGVSQVATTAFNAMFFAGLKDVEHKPHSFYIDRYPVGREATVAWPSVDLRFENDTRHGVLVAASIDPSTPSTTGSLTVRMWSTKTWDIRASQSERYNLTSPQTRTLSGDECVPNTGYGGFDIDVYRAFSKPGRDKVVRRETFRTTYTPSDTVVCQD